MPGSATTYLQGRVLSHTLAYGPMTAPTGIYIGLCLAAPPPTAGTGGVEVLGGSYARIPAVFAITGTANIAANTVTLSFPTATANWGSIGWFELWDALTAGNRLYWGPLVDPVDFVTPVTRNVLSGDIVRLAAGSVSVQAI